MMEKSWREKWQAAYEQAAFYSSFQNTIEFWDKVAGSGSAGLDGQEHILVLMDALESLGVFEQPVSAIDIGCGLGDYTIALAEKCAQVTALDSAAVMMQKCKERLAFRGIQNVKCVEADFFSYQPTEPFDLVVACLNPATYCPDGFDLLLKLSKKHVVYMTMDMELLGSENEKVYRGTNSVRYAEAYLEEKGIAYEKIPYLYKMPKGEVKFAFLIV